MRKFVLLSGMVVALVTAVPLQAQGGPISNITDELFTCSIAPVQGTYASMATFRPDGSAINARGSGDLWLTPVGTATAQTQHGLRSGTYHLDNQFSDKPAIGRIRWEDGEIEQIWVCDSDMAVKGENGHTTHFLNVR